jgi:anti-anti-sigma regulatory factor
MQGKEPERTGASSMRLFPQKAVTLRFQGSVDASRKAEIREAFRSLRADDDVLIDLSEAVKLDATFAVEFLNFSRNRNPRSSLTVVTTPAARGKIVTLLGTDSTANVVEVSA